MKQKSATLATAAKEPQVDCLIALKALADSSRLRILNYILEQPAPVTEIAKACSITTYNASRHLSILHRAGLVERTKDAQRRVYRISDDCDVLIDRKRRTLDLKCCQFKLDALLSEN